MQSILPQPNPSPPPNDEFRLTVSPRGGIIIPAPIRQRLKIKPKDQIVLWVDDDHLAVKPLPMSLEEVMGSVPPLGDGRDEDIDSLIAEAKADHYAQKYNR